MFGPLENRRPMLTGLAPLSPVLTDWTEPPPPYLYRYMSLDGGKAQHAETLILRGELYFSSPLAFNDPFDCLPQIVSPDSKIKRELMLNAGRKRVDGKGDPAVADASLKRFKQMTRPQLEDAGQTAFRESMSALGISCFSYEPDHILMWSHYADRHRGICVRFDMSWWPWEELNLLFRVQYDRGRPTFRWPMRSVEEQSLFEILTRKADLWAYEREVRCFIANGVGYSHRTSPVLIDQVIVGAACSAQDIEMVRSWCGSRFHKTSLLQARMARDDYRLNLAVLL